MNNRTEILREPGHIILDAAGTPATFYSETPITVEMVEEVVDLPSSMFGSLDKIPVGRLVKIKFLPQQFSLGAAQRLFPFAALARGSSIVGSADKTLDIHTISGKRVRIPNAFLYAEPMIRGDVRKTPFGEVEFWGIIPLGGDGNSLTNYFEETSVAYPGDSLLNTSQMINPAWYVTVGSQAIDLAEGGFEIKTSATLVEDKVSGYGLINVSLTDYSVQISFEALNLTRAIVNGWLGFGTPIGGRKSAGAQDITAQWDYIYTLCRHAHLLPGTFTFDAQARVVGKLTFQTTRSFVENTEQAQFVINDND